MKIDSTELRKISNLEQLREAVGVLLDYDWDKESEDYAECYLDGAAGHVFETMCELRSFFSETGTQYSPLEALLDKHNAYLVESDEDGTWTVRYGNRPDKNLMGFYPTRHEATEIFLTEVVD